MAHPKHNQVRLRYRYCCGYCAVSEIDVGGELTVDHHRPLAANGDDSDDNLVYACNRCNQYKGDFFPNDDDLRHGRRVLHPLQDDIAAHIQENQRTRQLEPLTETGHFHIALLQLNRPALVEHRLQQRLVALMAEKQSLLEAENRQLRAIIAALEEYIAHLRQLLGLPS
jgi:hypothetical protein